MEKPVVRDATDNTKHVENTVSSINGGNTLVDKPHESLSIIREQQTAQKDSSKGATAVLGDLAVGAYDEFRDHPGRVAKDIAIGAATGAAMTFVAPEIAMGAAIGGVGYGAYKLSEHVGDWVKDGKTVADPENYSPQDVQKAHADLQAVGGRILDAAVTIPGYMGGGALASGFEAGLTSTLAASPYPDAVSVEQHRNLFSTEHYTDTKLSNGVTMRDYPDYGITQKTDTDGIVYEAVPGSKAWQPVTFPEGTKVQLGYNANANLHSVPRTINAELPDGSKLSYDYFALSTNRTLADGTNIRSSMDGSSVTHSPDGTVVTQLKDGTKVQGEVKFDIFGKILPNG